MFKYELSKHATISLRQTLVIKKYNQNREECSEKGQYTGKRKVHLKLVTYIHLKIMAVRGGGHVWKSGTCGVLGHTLGHVGSICCTRY